MMSNGSVNFCTDVPNAPELLDVQCNKRDATIRWKSMGDNRAPILRYSIDYNTSFTPESWEKANDNVPAADTTYTVSLFLLVYLHLYCYNSLYVLSPQCLAVYKVVILGSTNTLSRFYIQLYFCNEGGVSTLRRVL